MLRANVILTVLCALLVGYIFGFANTRAPPVRHSPPRQVPPRSRNAMKERRINMHSQRVDAFKQVGTLYSDAVILPLYGRQTYRGSNRWNYYTVTNDDMRIQLPLQDCMDQNGCKELFSDDGLFIEEFGTEFKVKIYNKILRYIPFVY